MEIQANVLGMVKHDVFQFKKILQKYCSHATFSITQSQIYVGFRDKISKNFGQSWTTFTWLSYFWYSYFWYSYFGYLYIPYYSKKRSGAN